MERVTRADLYRYGGVYGGRGFIKGWVCHGFRYTFLWRKTCRYKKFSLKGIFYRILKRFFVYDGYHINVETAIDEGFNIFHRGTVIIGPCKIGRNCTMSHNITIGRTMKAGKVGNPVIGDNVFMGAGVVIIGDVRIGNNVMIAPNAFINFNVPDNSIVIGNPGKIIEKENPTKYYITNVLENQ